MPAALLSLCSSVHVEWLNVVWTCGSGKALHLLCEGVLSSGLDESLSFRAFADHLFQFNLTLGRLLQLRSLHGGPGVMYFTQKLDVLKDLSSLLMLSL